MLQLLANESLLPKGNLHSLGSVELKALVASSNMVLLQEHLLLSICLRIEHWQLVLLMLRGAVLKQDLLHAEVVLSFRAELLGLRLDGKVVVSVIEQDGVERGALQVVRDFGASHVDALELISDEFVVRSVFVLERADVLKDDFDFIQVASLEPELLFGIAQTVCLDVPHLVHSVLLLLSPLQLLVEEVENDEVVAPEVVSPGQILFEVSQELLVSRFFGLTTLL